MIDGLLMSRVVLLLTRCHDERQMAMRQRRKRERVRQHIREISKWYAGSRRYRRSTEALLQVRDPRTQEMRGIERWTGTEWLLESLLELLQQCRGVGAMELPVSASHCCCCGFCCARSGRGRGGSQGGSQHQPTLPDEIGSFLGDWRRMILMWLKEN